MTTKYNIGDKVYLLEEDDFDKSINIGVYKVVDISISEKGIGYGLESDSTYKSGVHEEDIYTIENIRSAFEEWLNNTK